MNNKKTFECKDDDFLVQSHDREEVKMIGRTHLKDKHNMEISNDELEVKISEAQ